MLKLNERVQKFSTDFVNRFLIVGKINFHAEAFFFLILMLLNCLCNIVYELLNSIF